MTLATEDIALFVSQIDPFSEQNVCCLHVHRRASNDSDEFHDAAEEAEADEGSKAGDDQGACCAGFAVFVAHQGVLQRIAWYFGTFFAYRVEASARAWCYSLLLYWGRPHSIMHTLFSFKSAMGGWVHACTSCQP